MMRIKYNGVSIGRNYCKRFLVKRDESDSYREDKYMFNYLPIKVIGNLLMNSFMVGGLNEMSVSPPEKNAK